MTNKFKLLGNVFCDSPKYYQEYEVELGFEKAIVHIPIESTDEFEKLVFEQKPKSITTLKKIVKKFNGEVIK